MVAVALLLLLSRVVVLHQRVAVLCGCAVAWLRVVLWLLASACVVAVRAGMEAKDSDLWLLAVRCAVRLCCGRDACQVGAGSVGRVPVLCVRQWVGGRCESAAVAVYRDGGE